jgi:hypothetical protein
MHWPRPPAALCCRDFHLVARGVMLLAKTASGKGRPVSMDYMESSARGNHGRNPALAVNAVPSRLVPDISDIGIGGRMVIWNP